MGRRWNWQSSRKHKDEICVSGELKDELSRRGIRLFSHESLRLATRDFKTLIGEGGFAQVYRGVLQDGIPVAVKVLRSALYDCKQGFLDMIDVFSHIHHKNLNRVIGCCVHEDARMIVSEYIDNGTLYDLITDSDRRGSIFSWEKRLSLCIGIARGISYLHHDIHPRLIHRDIKSANILVDSNLTPKITDFELVDFVYKDQDLPLEDRVVGTMGFLAPEYMKTGKYTEKVDVYSFGVLLLEVVSGRLAFNLRYGYKRQDDAHICKWAARLVADGRKLKVVDPLLTDFSKEEARLLIDVAFLCTQPQPEPRPSMSDVLLMLSGVGQPLRGVHMVASVDATFIQHYLSEHPTFSNVSSTSAEGNGLNNNAQTGSDNAAAVDSNSEQGVPDENEQIEPRGGQDRTQDLSSGATIPQTRLFLENTKNNNIGNLCPEAVYPPFRTSVFTHNTKNNSNVFPEAVYPPFRTSVFRRLGSRNLYACEPQDDISARVSQTSVFTNRSRNVFPEAVYPPFQTGAFRRQGSRDLYTFRL